MALEDTIQSLRNKPQKTKERILIVFFAILIPILIAVWILTFRSQTQANKTENQANPGSAVRNFGKGIGSSFQAIFNK